MHERCINRCRRINVSTRQKSGDHAHHNFSPVCHTPFPIYFWYWIHTYSPSLAKYHTHLLTLHGPGPEGQGSWTLTRHGSAEERMERDREIVMLEEKLNEVQDWEKRVKELDSLLHTAAPSEWMAFNTNVYVALILVCRRKGCYLYTLKSFSLIRN